MRRIIALTSFYMPNIWFFYRFKALFETFLESILDKSVVCLVDWFHLYVGNEVRFAFLVTGFRDVGCKALHLLAPFTAVRCIGVVWVLSFWKHFSYRFSCSSLVSS